MKRSLTWLSVLGNVCLLVIVIVWLWSHVFQRSSWVEIDSRTPDRTLVFFSQLGDTVSVMQLRQGAATPMPNGAEIAWKGSARFRMVNGRYAIHWAR